MNFNSIEYALFLPIVFGVYWRLQHKYRWIILLISSYYFYMSWNPKYVTLILYTTIVSYAAAILLEKNDNKNIRKCILGGVLISCLGVLFFFKYFNFISESLVNLSGFFSIKLHPITLDLLLPVGISFYTFQTLSYVIDVYRGDVKPEHNLGIYATFIVFFPQLVAGPIERTTNLLPQIKSEKKFDYELAMYGARQILWGLFKKVAVADVVAVYVDKAYSDLSQCSGMDLWVAVFLFTIQIYCDFSGYSEIAIGSAKLLGINLISNFKSPYFALSVKEFWSRWHISLSTWFRDYVYIPLGGNRCSKLKNYINLIVTFLVSGLWHGANWTFVIWGGIHGLAQVIEKIMKLERREKGRIQKLFSWICVFVFCNVAWVFFRADNLSDALFIISNLFGRLLDVKTFTYSNIGLDRWNILYMGIVISIVGVYDYLSMKKDIIEIIKNRNIFIRLLLEYALVILIGYALINSTGENSFVYFQF